MEKKVLVISGNYQEYKNKQEQLVCRLDFHYYDVEEKELKEGSVQGGHFKDFKLPSVCNIDEIFVKGYPDKFNRPTYKIEIQSLKYLNDYSFKL